MESAWSTGGHQRSRIQRSSNGAGWCARDSSNFRRAGRFLIDLPEVRGQRILRIVPVRERTWRGRERSERPILLPGGDSGSPLTQSNRQGSLNNRLASSSSEELQPRLKEKKETIYRREGGRENDRTLDAARPEIHSFSRIPFYARILSVISQPRLN